MLGVACTSGTEQALRGGSRRDRWQLSVGYRKQRSHRHFVGTVEQHEREERETAIVNDIHLFDVGLSYDFAPRYSLSVSVPFMVATRTRPGTLDIPSLGRPGPDQVSRSVGFGDIGVGGRVWVLDPGREERPRQNISFGFGVKLPTGKKDVRDTVMTAAGPREIVVDQSIQLGDGGWGLTFTTDMYKRVGRATLYGSGIYLVNPRDTNGVRTGRGRASEAIMSVADQYLARAGVIVPVPKARGWTVSFGGRVEGVPVRDILGKSNGFRRPGYAISVEPGVNYTRGRDLWSVSVPIAVERNRRRSVTDIQDGRHGDAAFADYLLVVGYSRRF
ncbi:MAG: hypothetical protein M3416_15535 [Acidobacteriota bacterium]|nr:hypothetical protein [Acidobacteriota bacterium]